jgi:hypothetical protein
VRKNGERSFSRPEKVSGLELVPPKDIHEARQIRDAEEADPGIVKRHHHGHLEQDQEPTCTEVRVRVVTI